MISARMAIEARFAADRSGGFVFRSDPNSQPGSDISYAVATEFASPSPAAIALNRFGLGAQPEDASPELKLASAVPSGGRVLTDQPGLGPFNYEGAICDRPFRWIACSPPHLHRNDGKRRIAGLYHLHPLVHGGGGPSSGRPTASGSRHNAQKARRGLC
jgi:hypothetical protein